MGRETRMVPENWVHPKNGRGEFIPLFGRSFKAVLAAWEEGSRKWDAGLVRDWETDGWRPKGDAKSETFAEWDGDRPEAKDYMPDWPASLRTHYQYYETCTEGTPISPVMASPEELARWLTDNVWSGSEPASRAYEIWLSCIQGDLWRARKRGGSEQ